MKTKEYILSGEKMITIEEAKALEYGTIIYQHKGYAFDTTINLDRVKKYQVTGRPKVWKRNPERVQVPLKHGAVCLWLSNRRESGTVQLNE